MVVVVDDVVLMLDDVFVYVVCVLFELWCFVVFLCVNFDVVCFGDGGDDVIVGVVCDEGVFEGVCVVLGVVWIVFWLNVCGIFRMDDGDDGVVVVACAGAWYEDGRGACETSAEVSECVFFGD